MSKSKTGPTKRPSRQASQPQSVPAVPGQATRETVESIAVAVILAFLFRAFVAEAFVIPTGSMAPTLMGQHKDVECPECGYWYQAGASIEIQDEANDQRLLESGRSPSHSVVVATTCPLCRHRQLLDLENDANKATFSGDRILVSKFIYDFTSPKRWDVIVFKYPFNAKQNFIKRLIGLPGETVLVKRGDIFIKGPDQEEFQIARKPDRKLLAMLQLVDDTRNISASLKQVGWPNRWQPWVADGAGITDLWTCEDDGHAYSTLAVADRDIWLRYHHVVPTDDDWQQIHQLTEAGQKLPQADEYEGTLITDFYAYNAFTSIDRHNLRSYAPGDPESLPPSMFGSPSLNPYGTLGLHWVGDLVTESELVVESDEGEVLLQLTKGGDVFLCRIDVATGLATLSLEGNISSFVAADGTSAQAPVGKTKVQGKGQYSLRYSNVDAEIRLWVDDKRIEFDGPTTYIPRDEAKPIATLEDPGDLAPAGIGTRGAALHVKDLRILRDIYYVATDGSATHEYRFPLGPKGILSILEDPTAWDKNGLFDSRGTFEHRLEADQFFPMGDNSPQSSDARMWPKHFFERDMLIGRALLIYWPHPWYRPIPYLPNAKRMRLIR